MRFGSCPEFISDCYDHSNTFESHEELELKLSGMTIGDVKDASNIENRISQRGSNASTDNTNYSNDNNNYKNPTVFNEEMIFMNDDDNNTTTYRDQFSQQEIRRNSSAKSENGSKPFIGAGHYSGFSGDIITDDEEELPISTTEHLMDQMTNTLNTLNISNNDVYALILSAGSDLDDLKFLLQTWCLEGPFPPDLALNTPRGNIVSINTTAQCTLVEWNETANTMKLELMIDPMRRRLVLNSPMKRYYGELYPNNGRDKATATQRDHLFV